MGFSIFNAGSSICVAALLDFPRFSECISNCWETGHTQLYGVTINHYDIDRVFYEVYRQLQQLVMQLQQPVTIEALSRQIRREDTAGWKTDYFQPYLLWKTFNQTVPEEEILELDFPQASQKLFELQSQLQLIKQAQYKPKSLWQKLLHR